MTCGNHSKRKGKLAVCFSGFFYCYGQVGKRNGINFFLPPNFRGGLSKRPNDRRIFFLKFSHAGNPLYCTHLF